MKFNAGDKVEVDGARQGIVDDWWEWYYVIDEDDESKSKWVEPDRLKKIMTPAFEGPVEGSAKRGSDKPEGPVEGFIKFDSDKPEWDLVPWEAFAPVVDILTQGAKKYAPNNWQLCEDPKRYRNAMLRHMMSYMQGEQVDEESGHPHMSHVICNALFLTWLDSQEDK